MKRVVLAGIRFYQVAISPGRPPACKYQPTCSCYGYEAVEKHGAGRGSILALWRLLRCNPFSKGGYDPVP
jgi:putative membrane protein insertion efficiency factor